MNESQLTKILAIASLVLALLGGLAAWQQGWFLLQAKTTEDSAERNPSLGQAWSLIPQIAGLGREKTYLLLFQNNLELRPSGGYIGNFGILKVKNGRATQLEVHDTNIFDGFGQVKTEPPQPIKDYLKIDNWQMRDANWSPDFALAAQQAEYFYHLQGGQENFDGIVGINAALLPALLKLTGPIYLPDFDQTFNSENVLFQLQYEVEQAYFNRGIDPGQRKLAFKKLVEAILKKISQENPLKWTGLKNLVIEQLNQKNILLYFKDSQLQAKIIDLGWAGQVRKNQGNDYLMLVEANLGGKKSNYFVKRRVDYQVDLSLPRPQAKLTITYDHQAKKKDWFSDDYRVYLRVYLPQGAELIKTRGLASQTEVGEDLGKTVLGNWLIVETNQKKTIEYQYLLPPEIKEGDYRILVQKQPGLEALPLTISVKDVNHKLYSEEKIIENDWEGVVFSAKQ